MNVDKALQLHSYTTTKKFPVEATMNILKLDL